MPDIFTTVLLEIEHEQVFPAHRVVKFFELEHGDFNGLRGAIWSSRNREPSWRLVDESGRVETHGNSEMEVMEHIRTIMQGQILNRA